MADIRAVRNLGSFMGLLVGVVACVAAPAPRAWALVASIARPTELAAPIDVTGEVSRLRSALVDEVPYLIVDGPKGKKEWIARTWAAIAASGMTLDRPQLLVVVDRNPRVQQMRIILARPQGEWDELGGTKVSTGELGRRDHFLTPTGVFLHTDAILDWRAEGTFNAHHIRGLGLRGMRVWDFGWQRAEKGWRSRTRIGQIRLLMHATDPEYLAKRLGRPASDGCIRIPTAINIFLDRYGVLDANYEQAATRNARFEAVLLPDRTPTPLAGNALVVIDSSPPP